MSAESTQLVDSHLHLWDLSSHQWYPAMQGADASKPFESLGDVTRMARDFLVPELREELAAADAELVGAVHVTAVSAPRVHIEEARWLDGVLDDSASRRSPSGRWKRPSRGPRWRPTSTPRTRAGGCAAPGS